MGQAALQDVFVSSVCDDVTLTVRQALVSDKTIYLVLDYQLPDTVDRAWLQQITESENAWVQTPNVRYFATGEMTWEDLRAADQGKWESLGLGRPQCQQRYLISGAPCTHIALWAAAPAVPRVRAMTRRPIP